MSMYSEPDRVQAVRRLLAVKKHEQPPPGYFDNFSSRVIARIEAGERAPDSFWDRLTEFWTAFETKPVLAGAVGMTFCGLITFGFFFSDRASGLQSNPISMYTPGQASLGKGSVPAASPLFGQLAGFDGSSTGNVEVLQVSPSLFQQGNRKPAQTLPANFVLPQ